MSASNRAKRAYWLPLLLCFVASAACSGGGGGGGSGASAASSNGSAGSNGSGGSSGGTSSGGASAGQPTIQAAVFSSPMGATSSGSPAASYNSSTGVLVENQAGTSPISTASVTVNGVPLTYSTADGDYLGTLNVAPGAPINLSVTVGGATYTASAAQFQSYPTILTPAANATWSSDVANDITWSGAASYDGQYALAIGDSQGKLVWPGANRLLVVPATQKRRATVDANTLSAGSDLVIVGLYGSVDIAGAAPGSRLDFVNANAVPITVTSPNPPPPSVSLSSLEMSSAELTLAPGGTRQLALTGKYSDGSTQDLTTQASWSSSDPSKVTVSGGGLVTAVAAGNAVVTAGFGGSTATANVYVFQPNPSPTPALSQSVTYQIDPAHSGKATVGANGPTFPPSAHWSTTLSGPVSYPIVAGGEVIVVAGVDPNASSSGTSVNASLYALDESTGAVIWGPVAIPGTYNLAWDAYDHGKVFVVDFDGVLRSFDAATGTAGWSRQLPGQYAFSSPPTAVNGVVYIGGAGSGGTLYAVDESNGALLWTALVENGDDSSPTVSQDGVFVSYPCQVYKFDPLVGTQLWRYNGPCEGGGGETSVFAGGFLYVRDPTNPPDRIYDAETGGQVGTFSSTAIPAISGQSAYYLQSGTLSAVDLATQGTRWTFAANGGLQIAPIVIDSAVVIGSSDGTVYALDAATGTVRWSGQAAAGVTPQNVKVGLGAGDGYLVVPSGDVVNAWKITP